MLNQIKMTSGRISERLTSLDTLRGIAALIVFLSHFAGMTAEHTNASKLWDEFELIQIFAGSLGTNLLLLLSGLLMGWSLGKAEFDYRSFLAKRIVRIYTPYIAILCAAMIAWAMFPVLSKDLGGKSLMEYFLHQLVLIPGLFPDRPALTVSWTLSYIVAGYLLLPLMAIVYQSITRNRGKLIWLWVLCFLVTLGTNYFYGLPLIRVCYIPAGCILAEISRHPQSLIHRRRQMILPAIVVVFLVYFRFFLWQNKAALQFSESTFTLLFFLCGLGAISIATMSFIVAGEAWERVFEWRGFALLQFIGKRGYSFYLLHGAATKILVICAIASIPGFFNNELFTFSLMLLCMLAAVTMSHFSYLLLEQNRPHFVRRVNEEQQVART